MKSAETDSSLSAAAAVSPWEGVRAESVHPQYPPSLGAIPLSTGQTLFRVWAPKLSAVQLELTGPEGPADHPRTVELQAEPRGYFSAVVDEAGPGSLYRFRTGEGSSFPDPASRLQPHGVHEASAVVATGFDWTDSGWAGIPLRDYIIYELHIGTFTPQGTFESAIAALDGLVELGITAVELMPVAQCPGGRNWGYDGVYPYAAQNTWGGPEGLKRFVDACHSRGLAVVLDVVYNHLGPEGNYLQQFGHYFTHRYSTPWGAALNFDDSYSDEVRRYFIENALYWIRDCHIDALRLDAVHAIYDQSACPFLRELGDAVRLQGELCGRRACSIAESNLNDPAMILPAERGGNGLDGQWVDDLHHALHVVLTGEREGYYADFHGFDDLVTAWERGFIYSGQYSEFRHRRHGEAADGLPLESFVVCSQNHDQIGNRMLGERLTTLADFEQLKLAAGTVLLSPYVPLLFMGEEYAEPAPFPFFISHTDADLVQAVRNGRQEEFSSFSWKGEPPDPQSEDTFGQAKLDHDLKQDGRHAAMFALYREL
ncbi:MAG: malto-oligosyltrehalose trehalohydrolase, partial [Planctomycetaceae bacterium]|nr:malto-oligosyltrehalose trehalohydrolase [Planctomycetaceae bacterium]